MTLQKFIPLEKADIAKRQVWGRAAIEEPDAGQPPEIMDYAKSLPNFLSWSKTIQKNSGGRSLGNVRAMHGGQLMAVGRVISLEPQDVDKAIYVGVEVVDDAAWEKVQKGVYSGFSIGGRYGAKWPDEVMKGVTRYEAIPSEISLVDAPCILNAVFDVIKADGTHEMRKFVSSPADDEETNEPQDGGTEAPIDDEAVEQKDPNFQAASAVMGQEDERPVVDADDVEAIVIDMLTRLGLVEAASGPQPMSMAMRMDELKKQIGESAGLRKALDDQRAEISELKKQIGSDLAQIVNAVQVLEKRGSSGPVLRDLGEISPSAMAEMQKASVLKDLLKNENDPSVRQSLQAEITRLEIKAIQSKPNS